MKQYYASDILGAWGYVEYHGRGTANFPLNCRQFAMFFKRVKLWRFHGNLQGVAFDVTPPAQSLFVGRGSPLDESDQHENGILWEGLFSGPLSVVGSGVLGTLDVGIVGPPPGGSDLDALYYCLGNVTAQDISTGHNISYFETPPPLYAPSSFSARIFAHDAVLHLTYSLSISMYYQTDVSGSPGLDISGDITIEPAEFWPFGGLYDSTSGARL